MKLAMIFLIALATISISYSQPYCDFLGKDSLFTAVASDTINVWDIAACAYCSATFSIRVTLTADSLYVVQTDTAGQITTCDCLFNIRASISGLPRGTYWIVIYRDLLKQYGYASDRHIFIGSMQLSYQPSISQSLAWSTYQSECNPSSVRSAALSAPQEFVLYQNYPNPFNPTTTVRFQTAKSEFVVIKLCDLLGHEVQTLWAHQTPPGLHAITFEPDGKMSSGTYFCRMNAGSFTQTIMMVLTR
jgi:hypothetical protein